MRDSTWETHGHLGVSDNGKDPAPSATPGRNPSRGATPSKAEENSVCWEHEGIVGELHGRQCPCVQHQLERFDPITCRRGDTGGGGGRGRPYPYPSHDHSCSKGKQANLAHLKSPFI